MTVERKQFKILHVLHVRIKESKAFSKSKRRSPVFWHILKIMNCGKQKGVWEEANYLQVADIGSFSLGKIRKEKNPRKKKVEEIILLKVWVWCMFFELHNGGTRQIVNPIAPQYFRVNCPMLYMYIVYCIVLLGILVSSLFVGYLMCRNIYF